MNAALYTLNNNLAWIEGNKKATPVADIISDTMKCHKVYQRNELINVRRIFNLEVRGLLRAAQPNHLWKYRRKMALGIQRRSTKIPGDPVQSVTMQGVMRGKAT